MDTLRDDLKAILYETPCPTTPVLVDYIIAKFKAQVGAIKNPYTPNPLREFDHETTMALHDSFEACRHAIIKSMEE